MGNAKTPLKASSAREHFFELQRRDLGIDQNGSRIDPNRSFGTIIAKVNRFNPAMDRMKGATLINKGDQDWLFEVEGDPSLIDRRLGGKAKRPREKGAEEEDCPIEEQQQAAVAKPPQEACTSEDAQVEPPKQPNAISHRAVVRATRTPKRNRVSDPLGLGPALSRGVPDDLNCGPSRNTRSKAGSSTGGKVVQRVTSLNNPRKTGGRNPRDKTLLPAGGRTWKGKDKANGESGDIAEITAGIDGFSVFSNHQVDGDAGGKSLVAGGSAQDPTPGMVDAGDWAHSVTHSTKVGVWLEKTAEAGFQAPVDAPKSCAPSTVADLV